MLGRSLKYILTTLIVSLLSVASLRADTDYLLELGFQAGINYYVGDANPYIFVNPREVYGLQFRYKFDRRWALQVKGQGSRIAFKYPVAGAGFEVAEGAEQSTYTNEMISLDVVGEFNFFRFSWEAYDPHAKCYTPYIFLGLGGSLYDGTKPFNEFAVYMPFGIGFKWKFAKHCGLQAAWQHNLYFADNLENIEDYNNVQDLNGSNFFNCDMTGSFTIGLVFDFLEPKKVCHTCSWK